MKQLFIVAILLLSTNVFASRGLDEMRQRRAQRLFNSMNPVEAFYSKKFVKRVWNQNFPGTSRFIKPTRLCVVTNTVQTRAPIKKCVEWEVRLKEREFGKDRLYFTSRTRASRKADSKNGKGQPICSKHESQTLWAHIDDFRRLTFKVDFFRKTSSDRWDDKKLLGRHQFEIGDCGSDEIIKEAMLNGGEFSGGSRKLTEQP